MCRPKIDLAIRFAAKVGPADDRGCRLWLGAYSQKSRGRPSRPVFWVAYASVPGEPAKKGQAQLIVPAARFALHLHDGVPLHDRAEMEACHLPSCANPACVEPTHLYWGTADENRADRYGSKPRRDFGAFLPVQES